MKKKYIYKITFEKVIYFSNVFTQLCYLEKKSHKVWGSKIFECMGFPMLINF